VTRARELDGAMAVVAPALASPRAWVEE
jgi:hypothetical protein